MKNSIAITITARVNFCIIFILLLDTFIIPPVMVTEVFQDTYSASVGSNASAYGRSRYYLVSENGQKYKVPESVYIGMAHERSQFIIYKSFLFKRPLKISYVFDNSPKEENLNTLNNLFGEVVAAFIFIISLLNITRKPFLRAEKFNSKAVPVCSILLFWILNFYFSW